MSKFLKCPRDDILSAASMKAIANSYILKSLDSRIDEFLDETETKFVKNDGISEIQKMLASNQELRAYGTADELARNLKIYRDFPEAHKLFASDDTDPYYTTPVIYKSLKGDEYILKSDLYVILQNMTFSIFPGSNSEKVRQAMMCALKSQENQFPKKLFEFVKFDEKAFDEIEKEMRDAEPICYRFDVEMAILERELASGDFRNFLARMKHCHNSKTKAWNATESLRLVKQYYNSLFPSNRAGYMMIFLLKMLIAKTLSDIIQKRWSTMFGPNNQSRSQLASDRLITVRVFFEEKDNEQFVMASEMISAINRLSTKKSDFVKLETNNSVFIQTFTMAEILERFGDRIQNIQFIHTPIRRAKHRAVPIREFQSDEFCILASDAVLDLLKTMILGVKLFQKCQNSIDDWQQQIAPILAEHKYFDSTEKNRYFIRLATVARLTEMIEKNAKKLDSVPCKANRNARIDGFSAQSLKNELEHLGLATTFPEIRDFADVVYSEVVKRKNERFLRTCDLFDAIEHCQMICLLERIPNLRSFLHNQKGCHRVYGYKCELCKTESSNQKTSEAQNPDLKKKKTSEVVQNVKKVTEVLMSSIPESQNQKTSENVEIKKSPSPIALEASEFKNSNQKTSKVTPEVGTSILESQKPSAPESKAQKTSEVVKSAPTSSNSESHNQKTSEKKEEIQRIRKEIEEKMEENLNLKKQVFTLESSISEMRIENLRKEETFKERQKHLEEQISHLESELNEEKKKKKTSEFESEILEKNRQIEELTIRMRTENEMSQRMIQQLMDKLTSSEARYSRKTTTTMTSSSSGIRKCEICWNEMTSEPSIQCQQCRRPFHQKCASNWLEDYKQCPSCEGVFQDSNHSSS